MFRSAVVMAGLIFASTAWAETNILNVSYDVSREFYKDFNAAFIKDWKDKTGESLTVNQSHGGSTKQARSVIDGLQADIISMNQSLDIDILHERGKLIPADWQKRLASNSAPTASTTVFLVRKGNPKKIKEWSDLVQPGIGIILPNPKTSGNGRYSYLAAWGNVIKNGGSEAQAKDFIVKFFKNVPILDGGGRGATTTFVQRGIGDVLLTFESEVSLITNEIGGDQFEVVYPSISILAENPISLVDRVVDKRKTRKVSQAYLDFHYSDEAQAIAVKHHLRPRSPDAIAKYRDKFRPINFFTVDEIFGSWANAQKVHFADGGLFDQIYAK